MTGRLMNVGLAVVLAMLSAAGANAQDPQGPPPVYTGSLGGGFALTGGNTDTQNFNFAAELVRDPQTRNLIKGDFSYLRGSNADVLNVDRVAVNLRDEYTLSGRTFLFGEIGYLKAPFQGIVFLWSPTAGIGHRLIDSESTVLVVNGGAGGVLERNPFTPSTKSGSVTVGQSFEYRLSDRARFTQSLSSRWKTNDFGDSLTNFAVGLSTTIVGNLEVKVEFLESYKNQPVPATLKKNDTAFLTSFLMNF